MPDYAYVPTYLMYVQRDGTGWPITNNGSLSTETKFWAQEKVKELLKDKPLPLHVVHDWFFRDKSLPNELKRSILVDWNYALVHRALLAAGANTVWRLENV